MRRLFFRLIIGVLVIGITGFSIWNYTRPEAVKVIVRPVEMGLVERTVANTRAGTIKACRRAKLSPSIGGQIAKLPIHEGENVKSGALLLELWSEDLAAEVQLALNESRVKTESARALCLRANEAQREADRLVKLKKIDITSEEKVDKAVTEAMALKADCGAANASVLMSQSRIDVARARLERCRLVAPFDGIIAEINGELNEYITPSPLGIATPPAVDLVDTSCFYVTAPIDEVDAPEIIPGMTARITMDAFGDRRFKGVVKRIAPYVLDREKQARTVDVEVTFSTPEHIRQLLAGYSADVEIILEIRENTLRLPTEAVVDGKRTFVYSPDDGIVRERVFKKGISNWNYTEIISGLEKGDLVVVNVDQASIKDGVHAVIAEKEQGS